MLIGPTPRSADVPSWRPRAIELYREAGYDGTLYVPEAPDWGPHENYDAQVHWEWEAIKQASVVACWLPRDLATMPAFTTNVEIPLCLDKLVFGFPLDAPKINYLRALVSKHHRPMAYTLEDLVKLSLSQLDLIHHQTVRPANAG
jgi:hypothetical protein